MAQTVNNLPTMSEPWVQALGEEYALEKGVATHTSILTGRIPWTEELGRPLSMESRSQTRLSA